MSKVYHVTWVTHNSRISERMVTFGVKRGEPVLLEEALECEVAGYLLEIIRENNMKVLAVNICRDHIHMLLVCREQELTSLVAKLKGKSAVLFKRTRAITDPIHLWAQKFHASEILSEMQLERTIHYITHNRQKHGLSPNKGLQPLVASMLTPLAEAFPETLKAVA